MRAGPGRLIRPPVFKRRFPGGGNIADKPLAWYATDKADYLVIPTSNHISQYLDLSGNGLDTIAQSTDSARPTWSSGQLNALATSTYDGNDNLAMPAGLYGITNAAHTIFTVSKRNTEAGASAFVFNFSNGSGGLENFLSYDNVVGHIVYRNFASGGTQADIGPVLNIKYSIATSGFNGTNQQFLSVDGSARSTTTGSAVSTIDRAWFGARTNGTVYLIGGIAECIIYNRALSAEEILQTEIYLANKWGIYHPNATWINAYNSFQQMLINAWKINKDDAFLNTTNNPFAAIYDPVYTSLGSSPSVSDSGRALNTATEVTNPPVNTANAIGTSNGFLYNGTTTTLNAGSDATLDNLFAAGGAYMGVINPTTAGENTSATDGGRIFDKNQTKFFLQDASAGTCALRFVKDFSVTNGDWKTTARNITLGAANVVGLTYNSASVSNNPSVYVNSLTAKGVTQNLVPTLTPNTDASSNLFLGNDSTSARTFDGYMGKSIFLKSVPTTAQLTSVFNFLAAESGVTLN